MQYIQRRANRTPVMERRCFENPARAIGKLYLDVQNNVCSISGRCEVNVFLNKVKFNLAFERNTCQYSSPLVLLRVGKHTVSCSTYATVNIHLSMEKFISETCMHVFTKRISIMGELAFSALRSVCNSHY